MACPARGKLFWQRIAGGVADSQEGFFFPFLFCSGLLFLVCGGGHGQRVPGAVDLSQLAIDKLPLFVVGRDERDLKLGVQLVRFALLDDADE